MRALDSGIAVHSYKGIQMSISWTLGLQSIAQISTNKHGSGLPVFQQTRHNALLFFLVTTNAFNRCSNCKVPHIAADQLFVLGCCAVGLKKQFLASSTYFHRGDAPLWGGGGVVSKCALRAALVQKSVETAHGDNPALSAVWVPFLLNMYTVLPLQQNGAAN